MATEFKLPELGENIKAGDVVKVNLAPGQPVKKDQPILELETDKAVVEVPSSVDGVVAQVLVKVGDKAQVGQTVFTYEASGSGAAKPEKEISENKGKSEKNAAAPAPLPSPPTTAAGGEKAAAPAKVIQIEKAPLSSSSPLPLKGEGQGEGGAHSSSHALALSAPSVRKLAREIGVDLDALQGSGPGGRVTMEDVKAAARRGQTDGAGAASPVSAPVTLELQDFSRFGNVERKAMTSVRRKTAERMSAAWTGIPHVTQHDDADITEVENLRQQFGKRAEAAGGNLTVTVIVMKIVAAALKKFPQFNASVDMSAQEIIYKKYCHVGVAVDTDRGLIVPVIRDVDKKNIVELSVEITQAAERARGKKTTLEEMQGGSITITNLGGIGGNYFTPIINPPEVAILGLGRWRYQQVYVNGEFKPRKMMPLSLSYDHRVIDGADAARFLRWVADTVNEPFLMDLEG